jgi:hypothetical protein
MRMTERIFLVFNTLMACCFLAMGWGGHGYLHYVCLIAAGALIGHLGTVIFKSEEVIA